MIDDKKVIFVLAPHKDDGELGLGGSISKFIEQGKEIFYIAFSSPETPLGKDVLVNELKEAAKILGIKNDHLIIYNFPVRKFSYKRQMILDELIKLKLEYNPDLVFLPSTHDLHQDHSVIQIEGTRAFKTTTILGYEMPWNNITFSTQCFNVLTKEDLDKKIRALECYKSQKNRTYINPDFIRGLAKARGIQIQADFAEAFEVVRWRL